MNANDFEKMLYKEEIRILEEARSYLDSDNHSLDEMRLRFRQIVREYAALLNTMRKMVKISDSQARELKKRENSLQLLLFNANQGFLTFRRNFLIDKEYSHECIRLFGRKIASLDICKLLADGDRELEEMFRKGFLALLEPAKDCVDDTGSKLPEVIKLRDRFIRMEAKYLEKINDWDDGDCIMLILTDITREKAAQEKILYLSYHDRLTGLYNRAYLDVILPDMQSPENLPLSIIVGDMNGLKLTNDVFGHEDGDRLLVNMSNILRVCTREHDIIIRWGGDEFLLLLPGTGADRTQKICERIRNMCFEHKWEPIELSIAMGTATQEVPGMDFSELFAKAEAQMYTRKTEEASRVKWRILASLEKTLASRCDEKEEHAANMVELAARLWTASKPVKGDLVNLKLAARLHDIGKVSLAGYLFEKKGTLTAAEWDMVKRHSEAGYRAAKALDMHEVAMIILSLHERWDGNGYPQGLRGEQIPLESRIISIVETYDVLTRGKSYKEPVSPAVALKVIAQNAGTQFDPFLVERFNSIIPEAGDRR